MRSLTYSSLARVQLYTRSEAVPPSLSLIITVTKRQSTYPLHLPSQYPNHTEDPRIPSSKWHIFP